MNSHTKFLGPISYGAVMAQCVERQYYNLSEAGSIPVQVVGVLFCFLAKSFGMCSELLAIFLFHEKCYTELFVVSFLRLSDFLGWWAGRMCGRLALTQVLHTVVLSTSIYQVDFYWGAASWGELILAPCRSGPLLSLTRMATR